MKSLSVNLFGETNLQNKQTVFTQKVKFLSIFFQVPMNLFIMYMSGNTISIFPIMMVVMMAIRPIKTLFSVNATFKALDNVDGGGGGGMANLGQKCVFVLGNLVGVALALWKCHGMGLLPTHTSDWLAFADPVIRAEWAYA